MTNGVPQVGSSKVTGRGQPDKSDPLFPNNPAPEPTRELDEPRTINREEL